MKITVDNEIRIDYPNAAVSEWVKNNLVVSNPEYVKKTRMHFWTGNTPQKLFLYRKDGDTLILPFGCIRNILEFMTKRDMVSVIIPQPKMVWYAADVPLYDYQQTAVKESLAEQYGILQSPAGSGKTQMGIAMIVMLGRRALWLTHTKDLLDQSMTRALQYIDESLIGTITEGKVHVGKGITFATVQTMCSLDLSQYKNMWDVIIVDECHRVAGTPSALTQFSKVLNSLSARHKYGLSATVHRADGMIKATYALLGDVIYKVPDEAVKGKIMQVAILPKATNVGISDDFLDTDGTIVYSKLVNYLAGNEERNRQIVNDLVRNAEHFNLILSDRVAHLETLMSMLPEELKEVASKIDGKMSSKKAKEDRINALVDMRIGTKHYLFATYALAREGLDIPRLDRLYLVTPQKDYAVITQSVGRVARTFEGKCEPVVYDYVDGKIQYLFKSYKKRCTSYRKLGCRFIEEDGQ